MDNIRVKEEDRISLEQLLSLLNDRKVAVFTIANRLCSRKAVPWKGRPEKMPKGVKKGLGIIIGMSKACSGVKGTTLDPKTGKLIPRKGLCQRAISEYYLNKSSK